MSYNVMDLYLWFQTKPMTASSITSEATLEQAVELGPSRRIRKIKEILGRTPNFTEVSIFSVMWSEHCSYKTHCLAQNTAQRWTAYVIKAGEENAGLVDIGEGLACAFKIESHNHPQPSNPTKERHRSRRHQPRHIYHGCSTHCSA